MDPNGVRELLVKAITEIQKQSGRSISSLDDNICPFSDLEGFDSLNGEEVPSCCTRILLLVTT